MSEDLTPTQRDILANLAAADTGDGVMIVMRPDGVVRYIPEPRDDATPEEVEASVEAAFADAPYYEGPAFKRSP